VIGRRSRSGYDEFADIERRESRWLKLLLPLAGAATVSVGFGVWHHVQAGRSNKLAVKYGLATSAGDATAQDRCTAVLRDDYDHSADPGLAGLPPHTFATLVPRICELAVARGRVHSDGTISEADGHQLTIDAVRQIGAAKVQTMTFTELAVSRYHLARPGHVTRWHRCVAMGYSGWDGQRTKTSLPRRDLYQRAIRTACTTGVRRGIVPASGAPVAGSAANAAFQRLVVAALRSIIRSSA
jgi:hypothetical protein